MKRFISSILVGSNRPVWLREETCQYISGSYFLERNRKSPRRLYDAVLEYRSLAFIKQTSLLSSHRFKAYRIVFRACWRKRRASIYIRSLSYVNFSLLLWSQIYFTNYMWFLDLYFSRFGFIYLWGTPFYSCFWIWYSENSCMLDLFDWKPCEGVLISRFLVFVSGS